MLVSEKDISQAQKLTVLLSHVGEAKEWIKYYMMSGSENVFKEAMQALEDNYGDPFEVADAFRDKLESWPKIGGSDFKSLKKYAQFLKQCKIAMDSNEHLEDLNNPRQFKNFVKTLPVHLIQRWSREAGKTKRRTNENPTFAEYADFVMDEALLACDKTTSYQAIISDTRDKKQPPKKDHSNKRKDNSSITHSTHAATEDVKPVSKPKPTSNHMPSTVKVSGNKRPSTDKPHEGVKAPLHCNYCKTTKSHVIADCRKFGRQTHADQQAFMKSERLCFKCLERGHSLSECKSDLKCSRCSGSHATCLHREPNVESVQQNTSTGQPAQQAVSFKIRTNQDRQHITTMTVPVYVSSSEDPASEVLTYALIDNQSDKSYILQEISDLLLTARVKSKLKVSTITSRDEIQWSDQLVNLQVRGFSSTEAITVNEVYSLPDIPASSEHIPTPQTAAAWPHLEHLAEKFAPLQECQVGMIIGFPCSIASLPLQTVDCEADRTLPYAVKTILGWSIIGGKETSCTSSIAHRIHTQDITTDQVLQRLEEDLTVSHSEPKMSQNDLKFLSLMDSHITQDGNGYYTMPLPFAQKPDMPDNRAYAMTRFKGLERKLAANPDLNLKYREFMQDIIANGEAEEVQEPGKGGSTSLTMVSSTHTSQESYE